MSDVLGLDAGHKAPLAGQEALHDGAVQTDVILDHAEQLPVPRGLRKADGEAFDLKGGSDDAFATVRLDSPGYQQALADGATEVMRTVFEDGRLLVDDSFAAIRARAAG